MTRKLLWRILLTMKSNDKWCRCCCWWWWWSRWCWSGWWWSGWWYHVFVVVAAVVIETHESNCRRCGWCCLSGGHKKIHAFNKVILHSMDWNRRGDKLKPPLLDPFGISALRPSPWSNTGDPLTIAMADKWAIEKCQVATLLQLEGQQRKGSTSRPEVEKNHFKLRTSCWNK